VRAGICSQIVERVRNHPTEKATAFDALLYLAFSFPY
jgi:hypothetical protein